MMFDPPLVAGTLLRRYKRFLADIDLGPPHGVVTAHCPNPGSMMGLSEPGATVYVTPISNPKAKLKWRWDLVEAGGTLVCINTGPANAIAADAIAAQQVPALAGYDGLRREVRYGQNSRIDILLEGVERPPAHVEVKSVTLSRAPGIAEFPDAVTKRGAKHLDELAAIRQAGGRAVMLFLVLRNDCTHFRVAGDIDPVYAARLEAARRAGVEVICLSARVTVDGMTVDRPVEIDI